MVEAVETPEISVEEQYNTLVTRVRTYLQNCERKKEENKNRGIGLPHLLNLEVSEDSETNCIYFQDPHHQNIGLKLKGGNMSLVNWNPNDPTSKKKEYCINKDQQQLFLDIFSEQIYVAEEHLRGNKKANLSLEGKSQYKKMLEILPKMLIQAETTWDLSENFNSSK